MILHVISESIACHDYAVLRGTDFSVDHLHTKEKKGDERFRKP